MAVYALSIAIWAEIMEQSRAPGSARTAFRRLRWALIGSVTAAALLAEVFVALALTSPDRLLAFLAAHTYTAASFIVLMVAAGAVSLYRGKSTWLGASERIDSFRMRKRSYLIAALLVIMLLMAVTGVTAGLLGTTLRPLSHIGTFSDQFQFLTLC